MELENLKYPIGRFQRPDNPSTLLKIRWMKTLTEFPSKVKETVLPLTEEQLNTPYRPGGWTVKQVVHHLADSHMNAFCRIKLTLTEDSPSIKPYNEAAWAAMDDYQQVPIEASLNILKGLHPRMSYLFQNLSPSDWQKHYVHPEYGNTFSLETVLALYAWHSEHHLAHITQLLKRMDW